MAKPQVERVPGRIERSRDKPVRRRYPSDQGEYATEKPQDRADPTTTRNRAARAARAS
jgi:hypothetical protein